MPQDDDVGNDVPNVDDIQKDAICDGNQDPGLSVSQEVQQDISGNVDMGKLNHKPDGMRDPTPNDDDSAQPGYTLRGRTIYKNVGPKSKNEVRTSVRESLVDSRKESKFKLHCANRGLAQDGSEVKQECQMDSSVGRKRTRTSESTSDEDIIPEKKLLIGTLTAYVQLLQARLEGLSDPERINELNNEIDDTVQVLCKLRKRSHEMN